MTKVLMVASEATPFAKTGGLAEVIGSLAPSLRAQGEDVAVFLPRYRSTGLPGLTRAFDDLQIWLGSDSYPVSLYQATDRGVPYYFLDCPALFDRDGLYGDSSGDYPDNYLRFAVFSRAALEVVRRVFRPQVIHCHDWQAALAPVYLRTLAAGDPTFLGMKTVLTIHNLGYQGLFDRATLPKIGLDAALFRPDGLEYFGQVGFLKGGLLYSDAVTTVSRKYAEEIQTPELGFGLDGVLRSRAGALTGILNGVDYAQWDPRTDSFLAARYSADNLLAKRTCKADLLDACSLSRENLDRPLIGIVSRFAGQKGFELLEQIAPELLAEDLSLVALGTGDPRTERFFTGLAEAQPDRFAVRIAYDNALAHKIEAGADIFLMPSLYEPSGLNQMYSLRYGTVPVVRATGGLDDTVDGETGFKFQEYSGAALLAALRAALAAYKDPFLWTEIVRAGMRKDYSWRASAREYSALYRRLAG
jgi:starch synthase